MKKFLFPVLCSLLFSSCDFSNYVKQEKQYDFNTVFEKSEGTRTATYPEVIAYYKDLAAAILA